MPGYASGDMCFLRKHRTLHINVSVRNSKGVDVSFIDIQSNKGHDAFLLDIDALKEVVGGFLGSLDV